MALIPYPDPDKLTADVREILSTLPLNIVHMLTGTRASFKPVMGIADALFNHAALTPILRELVTLRIGHRLNAAYMLNEHQAVARAAGVSKAQMEAISGTLPASEFSEAENAAIMLVDSLIDNPRAPESLVLKVYGLLGEAALHEVLIASGFYQLVGRYMETLKVDLDQPGVDILNQMKELKIPAEA